MLMFLMLIIMTTDYKRQRWWWIFFGFHFVELFSGLLDLTNIASLCTHTHGIHACASGFSFFMCARAQMRLSFHSIVCYVCYVSQYVSNLFGFSDGLTDKLHAIIERSTIDVFITLTVAALSDRCYYHFIFIFIWMCSCFGISFDDTIDDQQSNTVDNINLKC